MMANVLGIKVDLLNPRKDRLWRCHAGRGCLWRISDSGGSGPGDCPVVDTIEPDPELTEKYERQYRKFAQIYPTVKGLFPVIG